MQTIPPHDPKFNGVDLDVARRPGYQSYRKVGPWPHTKYPPERQPGEPAAPKHGRANKEMPPVFGTATPPHGLSGAIRKAAYAWPDHYMRHWMLLLFADRVDAWGRRAKKLATVAAPLVATGTAAAFARRRRR